MLIQWSAFSQISPVTRNVIWKARSPPLHNLPCYQGASKRCHQSIFSCYKEELCSRLYMTTNLVMHLKDNLMDRVLNTVGWWRPLQAQFSGPFWPIFGSYWPSWSFLFGGVKSTPLQTLPKQYLFWATNDLFMINIAVRINAVLIWSATTEQSGWSKCDGDAPWWWRREKYLQPSSLLS